MNASNIYAKKKELITFLESQPVMRHIEGYKSLSTDIVKLVELSEGMQQKSHSFDTFLN